MTHLVVWIIIREERHYQTNETQSLRFVEAVTGTDPHAVQKAAEKRAAELEDEDDECDGTYRAPGYRAEKAEAVRVVTETTEEN